MRPERTGGAAATGAAVRGRSGERAGASAAAADAPRRGALRVLPPPPLRVVDVALFYGERSGGIRSYLDAKADWSARTDAIDHHVIVPGARERHDDARHELPGLRLFVANGYRVPLGSRGLRRTLEELRPDVVLLHDPFWSPLGVARAAHEAGARTVAVHHGSVALDAAGLPVPDRIVRPLLRAWMRRAAGPADAVMSAVDTFDDLGRGPDLPLRLGVDDVFRPRRGFHRGDHVLYVGRLAREKGVMTLLEAAARSDDPWPLRLVGAGPLEGEILARAEKLGIGRRVSIKPFVRDRDRLARLYAGASCVVMPGPHETFGLVALEAAASGARVVAASAAPSAEAIGELCTTFAAGAPRSLLSAIEAARAAPRDDDEAARVAAEFRWDTLFDRELGSLEALVR